SETIPTPTRSQVSLRRRRRASSAKPVMESQSGSTSAVPDSAAAATEPLACVSCRSRKLKCDRTKPACARCVKGGAGCCYPESRRKPTFKRRNVKELEARLGMPAHPPSILSCPKSHVWTLSPRDLPDSSGGRVPDP